MRRFIELLLLTAGLAGVGIWIWSDLRLSHFQKQANRALEQKLSPHPTAPLNPPSAAPAPREPENGALMGRLVIPRLKLEAVVREGTGERSLDVALGHIPGTALPGQAGNIGIAGHRDTLFRGLRNIAKDDWIELDTPDGRYRYQVEGTSIVKPKDVSVLDAGKQSELTLVTCYPFYYVGPAPNRFIVKARLAPREADATPPAPPPAPVQTAHAQPPKAKNDAKHPRQVAAHRVNFELSPRHSRELAPGILMGVSWTDPLRRRADGWLWVGSDRRTIWLRDQPVNHPFVFHSYTDGQRRELMITRVTAKSVSGYMMQAP